MDPVSDDVRAFTRELDVNGLILHWTFHGTQQELEQKVDGLIEYCVQRNMVGHDGFGREPVRTDATGPALSAYVPAPETVPLPQSGSAQPQAPVPPAQYAGGTADRCGICGHNQLWDNRGPDMGTKPVFKCKQNKEHVVWYKKDGSGDLAPWQDTTK